MKQSDNAKLGSPILPTAGSSSTTKAKKSTLKLISSSFQGALSSAAHASGASNLLRSSTLKQSQPSSQNLTMEEFSSHVEPADMRIIVNKFEKRWLGESVIFPALSFNYSNT